MAMSSDKAPSRRENITERLRKVESCGLLEPGMRARDGKLYARAAGVSAPLDQDQLTPQPVPRERCEYGSPAPREQGIAPVRRQTAVALLGRYLEESCDCRPVGAVLEFGSACGEVVAVLQPQALCPKPWVSRCPCDGATFAEP